jgi:hypothetical protein
MNRNRIGLRERLGRMRGSPVDFDLSAYQLALQAVDRERAGMPLDLLAPAVFALVREAAHRTLRLRPFDEQVVAGLALHGGQVVEMQTGEGKTLAAVMPAVLNALTGQGVHVLTVNDYPLRPAVGRGVPDDGGSHRSRDSRSAVVGGGA